MLRVWGLAQLCFSHGLSGDADAAGPWTIFEQYWSQSGLPVGGDSGVQATSMLAAIDSGIRRKETEKESSF